MTTVLVTGVGAIIGYGILKSLRGAERNLRLIGTDIYPDAVGQKWCDGFYRVPRTSSPEYPDALRRILSDERVDFIIPGIEPDSHFFSDNRQLFGDWRVCLNSQYLIDVSKDKWAIYQELQSVCPAVNIPSFETGGFDELSRLLGVPFIVKPKRGSASKGVVRVDSAEAFAPLVSDLGNRLIAQPFVGTDDEEYTVSIFGDGQGNSLASIALQRRLGAEGSTAKASVRNGLNLEQVLQPLITHFKPVGPTNLQLRRDGSSWKLLEINPRISSSTSIRTAFGYNESIMALDFFLYGESVHQPEIRSGSAIRYIEDGIFYDRDHF